MRKEHSVVRRQRGLRAVAAVILVPLTTVVPGSGLASGAARDAKPSVGGVHGHSSAFQAGVGVAARRRLLFRFVSAPDFINVDIGNTHRRAGHGWNPGDPNSINSYWASALRQILDDIKSEHPAFLLVPGDLVGGRWERDVEHTGIFGPTRTVSQRLRAVITAGNFYYDAYLRWLAPYNLTLYPAIGDHDIGDNPWPLRSVSWRAITRHKNTWGRHFTMLGDGRHRFAMHPDGESSKTAYAFRFADTLFATVDEFQRTSTGVRLHLDQDQYRWLAGVLARARRTGVKHIIVQGHLPVLGSSAPSIPSRHSSRLFFAHGARSAFWHLLQRYHVDLYLDGELHAVSRRSAGGVVQITHGAEVGFPPDNYLVADVYADRIVLRVMQLPGRVLDGKTLWQMSGKRPPAHFRYRSARTVRRWVIR